MDPFALGWGQGHPVIKGYFSFSYQSDIFHRGEMAWFLNMYMIKIINLNLISVLTLIFPYKNKALEVTSLHSEFT
jgi:hypothetical protein